MEKEGFIIVRETIHLTRSSQQLNAVSHQTITNNSAMNKTVQSILSLTAFSALLIVITLFCGGLGFGRLFEIYGIMEYCFLGLLLIIT